MPRKKTKKSEKEQQETMEKHRIGNRISDILYHLFEDNLSTTLFGVFTGCFVIILACFLFTIPWHPAIDDRMDEIHQEILTRQETPDERGYIKAAFEVLSEQIKYCDGVNDSCNFNNAYGALVEGEAKCWGMSEAFHNILDMEGIPNIVAHGQVNNAGHAWNVVYFKDQWYVCDLTWAISAQELYFAGLADKGDFLYDSYMVPQDRWYDETGTMMYVFSYWQEELVSMMNA